MKLQKGATRYSKALFEMEGPKEERLGVLQGLLDAWKKNPEILTVLISPKISLKDKADLLDKATDDGKDKILHSFFNLLLVSNRCKSIPAIIIDYRKQVMQSLGVVEATIRTAVPLDPSEKEKLQKKLEATYKKKIMMKELIDPRVIGGAILSVGNNVIDFSVRGRLETLRKELCK